MAKAVLKTQKTEDSVEDFLNKVTDEKKRADGFILLELMKKATKKEPKMWGSSIVGFGDYHYKSPSTGREGDWFCVGFSPRKAALTLYLLTGLAKHEELMKELGKFKTGGGCLYINKLEDVNLKVVEKMVKDTMKALSAKKP